MSSREQLIDSQAADWFGRREVGLPRDEERAFQIWLAADARHARAYASVEETWGIMDRVAEMEGRGAAVGHEEADVRGPICPVGGELARARYPSELREFSGLAAGREDGRLREQVHSPRLIVVAAVLAAGVVLAFTLHRTPDPERLVPIPKPNPNHYSVNTGPDGFRKLELPDGSVVWLNANTSATVDLSASERHVDLRRGEAFFSVAADPGRPFVVFAANHAVQALGTAFNVAIRPEELEVLVTEGKVAVEEESRTRRQESETRLAEESDNRESRIQDRARPSPRSPLPAARHSAAESEVSAGVVRNSEYGNWNASGVAGSPLRAQQYLTAGQKFVVSLVPAVAQTLTQNPTSAEIGEALAWQGKLLDFDSRPLSEVIAEFNKFNQHQLVIADPRLASQTFGGTFRADNYEVLVELLQTRFNVIADRTPEKTVLRLQH